MSRTGIYTNAVVAGSQIARKAVTFPLGLFPQQSYDQCQLRLSPGDLVLLFTDGIVEAENPTGQPFDLDQLRNAFAGAAHGTAREVLTAIRSALQSHQKDTRPKDDQTLFVLRAI